MADDIRLEIYECNSCKKYFGVGIDFYLWNYLYKPKGISFNEAFEIYSKELKEKGATAIHLKEKPELCPYCKSSAFTKKYIKTEIPGDTGQNYYECLMCTRKIVEGIFEQFRLYMDAMGILNYKNIFILYEKNFSTKKDVALVFVLKKCPSCGASPKQIKLIRGRYLY